MMREHGPARYAGATGKELTCGAVFRWATDRVSRSSSPKNYGSPLPWHRAFCPFSEQPKYSQSQGVETLENHFEPSLREKVIRGKTTGSPVEERSRARPQWHLFCAE